MKATKSLLLRTMVNKANAVLPWRCIPCRVGLDDKYIDAVFRFSELTVFFGHLLVAQVTIFSYIPIYIYIHAKKKKASNY